MTTQSAVVDRADTAASDERWSQWVAKGVERDRRRRTRVSTVAAVVVFGFALLLARMLILG